jgi:hypothetical protein
MQRIAQALGVSQATITGDLKGLSTPDKPSRPKGGRPKGSGRRKKSPVSYGCCTGTSGVKDLSELVPEVQTDDRKSKRGHEF